jgi:hypothetical protein
VDLASEQVIKSEPAVVPSEVSGDNVDINAALNGTPDPDPNASPSGLPDLPATAQLSDVTLAKQQAYLDALKGASGGYDQDKWGALTQLGLNLMSEQPRYEGESLLSIAGRAGKEPLAALQQAQKAEKGAKLNYLKSKVDIEGIRTSLKTQAEKDTFDNAIRKMLAGAELTKAEAALVAARIPDIKLPRKISKADLPLAGSILNTSMRSALKTSPAFKDFLIKKGHTDLAEQEGFIKRLVDNPGVQAQVAQGLEEYRATTLGQTHKLPTKEETQIEALRITKDIINADPTLEKAGWLYRNLLEQW